MWSTLGVCVLFLRRVVFIFFVSFRFECMCYRISIRFSVVGGWSGFVVRGSCFLFCFFEMMGCCGCFSSEFLLYRGSFLRGVGGVVFICGVCVSLFRLCFLAFVNVLFGFIFGDFLFLKFIVRGFRGRKFLFFVFSV